MAAIIPANETDKNDFSILGACFSSSANPHSLINGITDPIVSNNVMNTNENTIIIKPDISENSSENPSVNANASEKSMFVVIISFGITGIKGSPAPNPNIENIKPKILVMIKAKNIDVFTFLT